MRPIIMSISEVRAKIVRADKKLGALLSSEAADVAPSLFVELRVDRHTRPEPPELPVRSSSGCDLPLEYLRQTSSSSSSTFLFEQEHDVDPHGDGAAAAEEAAPNLRLQHLCAEIISTETRYASDLALLCSHFTRPLHDVAPDLALDLYTTCDALALVHEALARQLATAMSSCVTSSAREVALVLEEAASTHFGLYSDYCAGFMRALQALEVARHARPEVEQVVQRAQTEIGRTRLQGGSSGAVDLFSVLIKPVQRICQYPLLFREIVSETAAACEPADHARVEATLAVLERSAEAVNEHVRRNASPVAARSVSLAKAHRIRRHRAVTPSPPLRRHISLPMSTHSQPTSSRPTGKQPQPTRSRARRSSVSAALGFSPPNATSSSPTATRSRRRSSVASVLGFR